MSEPRKQIVQVMLPWFGNHDGELYYSPMSFTKEGKVSRREAFRIMRKWYKKEIGVNVDKKTLERIWKYRHETFAIDENTINQYIHDMARDTYEQTEDDSDTRTQEKTD